MTPSPQDRLLAALRGEPSATGPADAAHRAGAQLRRLVLDEVVAEAPDPDAADEALMARLRAAGAFRQPQRRRWSFAWPAWLAVPALATALGAGLLFLPLTPPEPEPASAWRGAAQAQQLRAADPAALATELEALLTRHGAPVRRVSLPGGAGIELQARVQADATALRTALAERGVQVPANGQLLLRVTRP
jgi:hypothetical protein